MAKTAYTRDSDDGKLLTHDELRRLFRYDPETGDFIRLATPKRAAGGKFGVPAAAYTNSNGYVLISVGRFIRYRAHRLAWFYMTGDWPPEDVDHINGDRTDNRWCNLRAATRSQNLGNQRKRVDNTSGVKGVCFDSRRNKWKAQICINRSRKALGRYDTKEEAAAAYERAAKMHFGEFARTA